MQGILKAIAAAGVDQKTFAKEVGIDRYTLNKFVRGHMNPVPEDFKKICDRAGLPPRAVATVEDVDYGVIPCKRPTGTRKPEKRKKTGSLRFRYLPKQRKQIDKDLKTCNFATVQSWGDFCIKQLHAQAEQIRRGRR